MLRSKELPSQRKERDWFPGLEENPQRGQAQSIEGQSGASKRVKGANLDARAWARQRNLIVRRHSDQYEDSFSTSPGNQLDVPEDGPASSIQEKISLKRVPFTAFTAKNRTRASLPEQPVNLRNDINMVRVVPEYPTFESKAQKTALSSKMRQSKQETPTQKKEFLLF